VLFQFSQVGRRRLISVSIFPRVPPESSPRSLVPKPSVLASIQDEPVVTCRRSAPTSKGRWELPNGEDSKTVQVLNYQLRALIAFASQWKAACFFDSRSPGAFLLELINQLRAKLLTIFSKTSSPLLRERLANVWRPPAPSKASTTGQSSKGVVLRSGLVKRTRGSEDTSLSEGCI